MVSITSGASMWYKPCYTNMLNYDNDYKCQKLKCKSRFSLIVEQILAFSLSTNLGRKDLNLSPNFKLTA